MKDIKQARLSAKRAIERDYGFRISLFSEPRRFPKELQVLRMEVRLGTRTKIVNLLKMIEPGTEPTFAAIFNASIAKGVLLHFWTRLRAQLPFIEGVKDKRIEEVLAILAAGANGRPRPSALLQQLGCLVLVGSVGLRGAEAILLRHCSARSWQRYKRQLRTLRVPEPRALALSNRSKPR